ncbi:hypothetical protein [Micromonospora sp. NPDC048839]|uniref:DUF6985 domain-containing protein n=1 Tax=Micromonospora sp. NPDC048839 TaxID=3155641 RepID=UPI0033F48488
MTEDLDGWYRSEPITVRALGDRILYVMVNGYDDDPAKEDFHAAIAAFLSIDGSVLEAAAPAIFDYYQDVESEFADGSMPITISSSDQVWAHIHPVEVAVERDSFRDQHVYVTVECNCDWEPEHGLQIVLRDGRAVTKVGPYDGHLTNAAAFNRDDLEGVVYHRLRPSGTRRPQSTDGDHPAVSS